MTLFLPNAPNTVEPKTAEWMNVTKSRIEQNPAVQFGVPIRGPVNGQIPYYFGTNGWRGAYPSSFLVAGSNVAITGTSTVTIAMSSNVTNSFPNRTVIAGTNYSIQNSDYLIAYSTLGTAVTATLPTAVGINKQKFIVKDEAGNAGTNNITIAVSTGQTIDGATTKVLNSNYGVARVYSNNANYYSW